jgi:hypothetical protein
MGGAPGSMTSLISSKKKKGKLMIVVTQLQNPDTTRESNKKSQQM